MHKLYGFFSSIYNVAFGRTLLMNELKQAEVCKLKLMLYQHASHYFLILKS